MTRNPISFIVPAYNCADYIALSVKSISDGNLEVGDEILIVDDGSSDTTLAVAKSLQAKEPAIRILCHLINRGSAAAGRNTGVENAKNELVFCLDADNILVPGSIEPLRRRMSESQADAAAFGEIHFFQSSPDAVTHKWLFRDSISLADALAGHYWPGSSGNYMFTKTSWLRAGRYDESLFGAYDSWAFGIGQLATGSKMVTLPGSRYFHKYGYASAFVRDANKANESLLALRVLLKFTDLIEERDIEYVFGKKTRYTWFKNLGERPIHLRSGASGETGRVVNLLRSGSDSPGGNGRAAGSAQAIERVLGHLFRSLRAWAAGEN